MLNEHLDNPLTFLNLSYVSLKGELTNLVMLKKKGKKILLESCKLIEDLQPS